MSDSICIYDKRVDGVARVWIFDHGQRTGIGRYSLLKIMRLKNGKTARKTKYYHQKPAAICYAEKWLASREQLLKGAAQ